jgi:glutathione S-transferase
MIELYQFPWSPFCLVQRRILEYSRARFRVVGISVSDRSKIWRLTRQRYYQVPVLRDGRNVVFETAEDSQVLAKYLDEKLQLGLFPRKLEGVQSILWRHIENEVEGFAFKLNDVYWREFVPAKDQWSFVRHKERRFGRGCLEQWQQRQPELLAGLEHVLVPYEDMMISHPFLLDDHARFVDFDLHGMLANFLYSGHYRLPESLPRLQDWYRRISRI